MVKVLMVYPQYPDTFWSFKLALRIISKKAAFPPLGLLTVAAMLPGDWDKKLVDMNVTGLSDGDIEWADYVFVSAMTVQQDSVREVITRCRALGTKIVAGGPLFTSGHKAFNGVDHFVLNEAENTLPLFLEDVAQGCPRPVYTSKQRPDMARTPVPLWSLIDMRKYSSMSLQYSRGCPYNCEFCDIVMLNGHRPRTKDREQVVAELEAIYRHGWRGSVFIVDDNFIGNKQKLKADILPAITQWLQQRRYPFEFFTEVSINLADDETLMRQMVEAGFDKVFVGIESPCEESLAECNKMPNKGRDLAAMVRKMQNHGLAVMGGFILGFDSDPVSIFRSQINFIQNSGIPTAMVGLLTALRGTKLYQRLKREQRLLNDPTGDNTDGSLNFVPRMKAETLIDGYRQVLHTIYSPKQYYDRVRVFLREYRPRGPKIYRPQPNHLWGFIKCIWFLGIKEKGRKYYWELFISTLLKRPRFFPLSMSLAVYGFHFRKVVEQYISQPIKNRAKTGGKN